MGEQHLPTLGHLRVLVGYLGEGSRFDWWHTSFFDSSSKAFLTPTFPKTTLLAQIHGVTEAARLIHDEHLSVGCYHLFRLPEEVEEDLHHLFLTGETDAIILESTRDKETALKVLNELGERSTSTREGPIAIGRINDLYSKDLIDSMAGAYCSAFSQKLMTYPYLCR